MVVNTSRQLRRSQDGITLVELMVALVIGLVLSGAAIMIYSNSKHGFGVQVNIANVQENGRYVLQLMQEDVRMAGYWGLNYQPKSIRTAEAITLNNECTDGWSTDITRPIHVANNDNSSYANCISNVDYKKGTDILTVRHASSTAVAEDDIVAGDVYLHASLTRGALFVADADGTVDAGVDVQELPVANHRLSAHAYYVRPWSQTVGDGIPTLVRKVVSGTSVVAEPLAEYVEDFQVTLGIDMDWDGNVDRYDNDGITAAETDHVMTVIVEVLIRAPTGEAGYTNDKVYQLGDQAGFTPADSFRRQVFRETIFIRNWTGLGSV